MRHAHSAVMRALLVLALLGISESAFAQNTEFERLDRNRDGYISRIEALVDPEISKRFAQFDADKDRLLSSAEYRTAREDIERRVREDAALSARVREALTGERGLPWKG